MDLKQLEEHQATVRGLRDTIGTMQQAGPPPALGDVVDLIDGLAGVLGAFIDERLEAGSHAAAVAEHMKGRG